MSTIAEPKRERVVHPDEPITAIVVTPEGDVELHTGAVDADWLYATLDSTEFQVFYAWAGATCYYSDDHRATTLPMNPWGTRVYHASGGLPVAFRGTIIVVGIPDSEGRDTPPPTEWILAAINETLPDRPRRPVEKL